MIKTVIMIVIVIVIMIMIIIMIMIMIVIMIMIMIMIMIRMMLMMMTMMTRFVSTKYTLYNMDDDVMLVYDDATSVISFTLKRSVAQGLC